MLSATRSLQQHYSIVSFVANNKWDESWVRLKNQEALRSLKIEAVEDGKVLVSFAKKNALRPALKTV